MERDETQTQPTVESAVATSPFASLPKTPSHDPSKHIKSPYVKTPTTVGGVRPPLGEMHPSKVHQSTTKQADSGLILGFKPVKKDANGNIVKEGLVESTPTKVKGSTSREFGTPGFEFKFASQETQLSEEAKKLMESVREDVARIKAQMISDKDRQARKEEEAENGQGDRRIAKPRSRAGRFSAAHMAEFKKMDSIAGHPSAFRAAPGRFQPVTKTLKRTPSKANLDEQAEKSQAPVKSTPASAKPVQSPAVTGDRAKRVKHEKTDDASTRRPESTEGNASAAKPAIPRPRAAVRSSLMTPMKFSSVRSSTVRPPRTSMTPSLARSPESKSLAPPRTPQTEFNPRLKSNLPTLGNLKSILRRHQPLFSKDPAKIAAGTHVAAPDFSSDMLMGGARDTTDSSEAIQTPSPKKRVEFTLNTESHDKSAQASPSPSKVRTVQPTTAVSDIVYPTLPVLTPEKESKSTTPVSNKAKVPSIRFVRPSSDVQPKAATLNLPAVPHGIQNKKRRREDADDESDTENIPPADSTSDVRSAKKIKMAPVSPAKIPTPSPVKRGSTFGRPTPSRATPSRATPSRATPSRIAPGRTGTGTPASARPKDRPVLSMSRLNMLAKPKERR